MEKGDSVYKVEIIEGYMEWMGRREGWMDGEREEHKMKEDNVYKVEIVTDTWNGWREEGMGEWREREGWKDTWMDGWMER